MGRSIADGMLVLVLLVGICGKFRHADNVTGGIGGLFEEYYRDRMRLFPLEATAAGMDDYNDQLPNDGTAEFRARRHVFYAGYLNRLHQYRMSDLGREDMISYDILEEQLELGLEKEKFHEEYIPFTQLQGVPLLLMSWGDGKGAQPFRTMEDYDRWLGRLRSFPDWADTAIANFRNGMKSGKVLNRALVLRMIEQMGAVSAADVTKSLFYSPVVHFPAGIEKKDSARLQAAYAQEIGERLLPAYGRLCHFLQQEYLPVTGGGAGLTGGEWKESGVTGSGFSRAEAMGKGNGRDYYRVCIREFTTTDETPEEIYAYGLKEVRRIRTEMKKVQAMAGFRGSLKDFFHYMDTARRFMPFRTKEEVVGAYRRVDSLVEPRLPEFFHHLPKAGFDIRASPDRTAAYGSPGYAQGALDGSRLGVFEIPIPDPAKYNVCFGIEAVFLHEAVPGHHLQGAIQIENGRIPAFRRVLTNSAFEEGWALYCESMGKELGLYGDVYQYMAALGKEMHRAVRLVLDVGIHTRGMTRDEAIRYMMAQESVDPRWAVAEVERYMAWPGQALSYKIGCKKIMELREECRRVLGKGFDIADFHDALLEDGGMPLNVLDRKMRRWLEEKRGCLPVH